jgi:hypothetical protein
MTWTNSGYSRVAAALAVTFALDAAPAVAKAPEIFNGIVRHVSAENIKVYDPKTQKTVGFLLDPKFHNVFKKGGKTTELSTIAPGQYVKVYYDRKLLGAAHADRIYLLDQSNNAFAKQ